MGQRTRKVSSEIQIGVGYTHLQHALISAPCRQFQQRGQGLNEPFRLNSPYVWILSDLRLRGALRPTERRGR